MEGLGEGATKEDARARDASLLSRYFYDVAAFRGSLGKKGLALCWSDTIAKYSRAILYRATTDNTSSVGY